MISDVGDQRPHWVAMYRYGIMKLLAPISKTAENCRKRPESAGRARWATNPTPIALYLADFCVFCWWRGLDSNQRTGNPGRFTVCCL
jgi:hypothetical protein